MKARIEGPKEFVESKDPELAAKAKKQSEELLEQLNRRETTLARERAAITRRGLERAVLEDQYRYWRKLVLDCRAADTPDFEHFTRMFVELLEERVRGTRHALVRRLSDHGEARRDGPRSQPRLAAHDDPLLPGSRRRRLQGSRGLDQREG